MVIKDNDFVKVDYTGMLHESNAIFDTTVEEDAKTAGLFNPQTKYEPVIVCIGRGHLVAGLDKQLIGKDVGEYTFEVEASEGFGRKNPKLLKLIPAIKFKKEKITPQPGMDVNIDGTYGVIRSVTSGRVIVDFNHPLSGHDLLYKVKVHKIITEKKEKLEGFMKLFNIPYAELQEEGDKAIVVLDKKLEEALSANMAKEIKEMIGYKEVEFKTKEEKK